MDKGRARELAAEARVARLATRTKDDRIDLVPMTFAFDDDRMVTIVDHKPKTTMRLQRLDNIDANPEVAIVIDEYDDADWSQLWWVRLRGLAQVIEEGDLHERAVAALVAKYPQYRERVPNGPVVSIEIIRWQWWSSTPDAR